MSTRNIIIALVLVGAGVYAYQLWSKRNVKTINEGSFKIEVEDENQ